MANQTSNAPAVIDGHSAFATLTARSAPNPNGGAVGLVIKELSHQGKLNIRGDNAFQKKCATLTGLNIAQGNNQFSATASRFYVWLAPDEYLLLTEAGAENALARQITDKAGKAHFAVNNITDAMTSLHLKGPAVRDVLAKGCGLDLHKDHFKKGACAQTTLSHAGIILLALDDEEMILICRTSFTDYTVAYLCDAALEFGFDLKA